MSENTFEIVKSAFVDHLELDPALVCPESLIVDDLGADSLDAVELIMALEEYFDISIDEVGIDELKTIADIVKVIDDLRAETA
jgi:acyl carrier protein